MQEDKANFYFLDFEHPVEMARLFEQSAMIIALCGIFPAGLPEPETKRILDLGCGPGGWALEVAKRYPNIHVTGIDISELMIDYAQNWAYSQGYNNLSFLNGNFTNLPFTNNYFDFINAAVVQWFIPLDQQAAIFAEWLRVLQPGGILCFTEGSRSIVNGPTVEEVFARFERTIEKGGRGVPDLQQQRELMQRLCTAEVHQQEYKLDYSYGEPDHDAYVSDMEASMSRAKDYLIGAKAYTSEEEFDELYKQFFIEMNKRDFKGYLPFVVTWGRK